MGLFGGSKQESASSSSGLGAFAPKNIVEVNSPMLDFSSPLQVISALAVAIIWVFAYKRFK